MERDAGVRDGTLRSSRRRKRGGRREVNDARREQPQLRIALWRCSTTSRGLLDKLPPGPPCVPCLHSRLVECGIHYLRAKMYLRKTIVMKVQSRFFPQPKLPPAPSSRAAEGAHAQIQNSAHLGHSFRSLFSGPMAGAVDQKSPRPSWLRESGTSCCAAGPCAAQNVLLVPAVAFGAALPGRERCLSSGRGRVPDQKQASSVSSPVSGMLPSCPLPNAILP